MGSVICCDSSVSDRLLDTELRTKYGVNLSFLDPFSSSRCVQSGFPVFAQDHIWQITLDLTPSNGKLVLFQDLCRTRTNTVRTYNS